MHVHNSSGKGSLCVKLWSAKGGKVMNCSIYRFLPLIVTVALSLVGCGGDSISVKKTVTATTNNTTNITNNPVPVVVSTAPQPTFAPVPNSGVVYSIQTLSALYVSSSSATLYGHIEATWVSDLEAAYFHYRPLGQPYWNQAVSVGQPTNGTISLLVYGLSAGTWYQFQFFALVESGEQDGAVLWFRTDDLMPVPSGSPLPPTTTTTSVSPTPVMTPETRVVTVSADGISSTTALVHGRVNVLWQGTGSAYVLLSTNSNEAARESAADWVALQTDVPRPVGAAERHLVGLTPSTDYWYRFIAITGPGPADVGVWLHFRTLSQ